MGVKKKISAALFLDLLLDGISFSCMEGEKWRTLSSKKGTLLYKKLSFRTKQMIV